MYPDYAKEAEKAKEQLTAADRQDRRRAKMFDEWVSSPEWKEYEGLLNAKIQECAELLLQPEERLRTSQQPTNSEFIKGTMNGLILARDWPSLIIRAIPAQLGEVSDAPEDKGRDPGEIRDVDQSVVRKAP